MLHTLKDSLVPAAIERLVLLANHVLSSEPEAMSRLQAHSGRVLRIDGPPSPGWLPVEWPDLVLRVTPAGLIEWTPEVTDSDLRVRMRPVGPAVLAGHALRGEWPPLDIEGDVALAGDVDWLMRNVRWDLADEVHRLFGPGVAGVLGQLAAAVSGALRQAARAAADLTGRSRSS
jgi:ubiquinone biosynthesis protein UbiJ